KHAAMRGEARSLEGEDKSIRRLLAPTHEALRLLRAVEGTIDLDRGQMATRMLQFSLLRQIRWIERAAPRREGPAAYADTNSGTVGCRYADSVCPGPSVGYTCLHACPYPMLCSADQPRGNRHGHLPAKA